MNQQLTLLTMLYLAAPLIRACRHMRIIEVKKKSIQYSFENIMTIMIILLQAAAIKVFLGVSSGDALLMSVAVFGLIFDFLLNYLRNKPVFSYYGDFEDEANLSFIEKYVYAKVKWQYLLIAKVVVFLIAIYFYG